MSANGIGRPPSSSVRSNLPKTAPPKPGERGGCLSFPVDLVVNCVAHFDRSLPRARARCGTGRATPRPPLVRRTLTWPWSSFADRPSARRCRGRRTRTGDGRHARTIFAICGRRAASWRCGSVENSAADRYLFGSEAGSHDPGEWPTEARPPIPVSLALGITDKVRKLGVPMPSPSAWQ